MTAATKNRIVQTRLQEPLADCRDSGDGIGFVGPDIPLDVLLATDRPFGHLPWNSVVDTSTTDRWLESSFPFWARSIVAQWAAGAFDDLATVIFSRSDDASQRLYYYIAELRRRGKLAGPEPRVFDIALIRRESSLQHTGQAVRTLMDWLDVTEDALLAGIDRGNALRRQINAIDAGRVSDGPLFEQLGRAALWTNPAQWLSDFSMPDPVARRRRILLAGSMPPDDRIHRLVEQAEASVVGEAHALALRRCGAALELGKDTPPLAVARHLRRVSTSPRAFLDRAAWLAQRSLDARADAVILWLTREEEALAWSVPVQRRALAAAGIPGLILSGASWQADDGIAERIREFCTEAMHATA